MLKLTTDKHEASRGLSTTAELLVFIPCGIDWLPVSFYSTLNTHYRIVSYRIVSYRIASYRIVHALAFCYSFFVLAYCIITRLYQNFCFSFTGAAYPTDLFCLFSLN